MRLKSLDIFRGLTVVVMLLVNFQDGLPAVYRPFTHSYWDGCTTADIVFPCFLFIVGVTTHISISARRARGATDREIVLQIVRRAAILVALGLFLSAFPFVPLERVVQIRIPGVLQRIGAAYAIAALLGFRATSRQQVGIIAAILVGYWLVLRSYPLDVPTETLAARVDRYFMEGHIARKGFDSMGILATFPAAATVLLGMLCGRWLGSRAELRVRALGLAGAGCAALLAGLWADRVFALNRVLWSSSFALFTAGVAAILLAVCIGLVDMKRWERWGAPFLIFGANPIAAYVGSTAMIHFLCFAVTVREGGAEIPAYDFLYERLFGSWLSPLNASLAFAFAGVVLWLMVLSPLHRRGFFLKV